VGPVYGYAAAPPSGTVTVSGGPVSQLIVFSVVIATYGVTFEESNLPVGTTWYVNITTGPSLSGHLGTLSTSLANGHYTYRIATTNKHWSASAGAFVVSGASQLISVVFSKPIYTVTFAESGTLTGKAAHVFATTGWTVVLNGTLLHGTSSSIVFTGVANGTMPVLVWGPAGFQVTGSGTVTVHGPTTVPVSVTKGKTVTLSFHAKGLNGKSWCATVDGYALCSTTATKKFVNLIPGSYSYAVGSVNGYVAKVHYHTIALSLAGTVTIAKTITTLQVKYVPSGSVPALAVLETVSALGGSVLAASVAR
jgi:hypothetical protein